MPFTKQQKLKATGVARTRGFRPADNYQKDFCLSLMDVTHFEVISATLLRANFPFEL